MNITKGKETSHKESTEVLETDSYSSTGAWIFHLVLRLDSLR